MEPELVVIIYIEGWK